MNEPVYSAQYSLAVLAVSTAAPATYSLEAAARLAEVHPEMLRHYCRLGLFGEALAQPGIEPIFDDDTLFELRRFERYRREHGVSRKTLRLLCELWREIESLRAELRFRRGP